MERRRSQESGGGAGTSESPSLLGAEEPEEAAEQGQG